MESIKDTLHIIAEGLEKLGQDAPPDDAQVYNCPLCRDTGYILRGDRAWPCSCRSSSLLRERKAAAQIAGIFYGLSPAGGHHRGDQITGGGENRRIDE